ncbi:UDP-N-acetylmuramoyl-tripeptide--D-alanyl-D-alanine ligase [uncultured Zhongshania sp.]|uniref:UDP-N-acetylmuramoyl-tripeptide--D-alanyl-D- alanine ligase n=1 Tax=uncultured Zhongshania sp. TaxID=1642288 RepID=UPI0025EF5A73|nr:UDP-N-acetylmuramoyl-tripeptide--D-alanyl-D-alanine ligase [uncultured Zhongshania sp.]
MISAMTLAQIANCADGKLCGADVQVLGLSTDTRKIKRGDLFVALSGENFNGNKFVEDAKKNGAIAALVSESTDILPSVLVTDSRRALGLIARENRRQFSGSLVAVTGSSGKTSTKEMLASIFAQHGDVFATQGNFNNEIGVPLSLLAIEEKHRFAVIEMGAAKQGDIAYLCEFAEPDIAVLTNAQPAHIAGFGSLEGVAKTKGEIFSSLPQHGLAVINADDTYCELWRSIAKHVKQRLFSLVREDVDVFARDIDLSVPGTVRFELVSFNGSARVCMPLSGRHMIANALAAAAASLSAGVSLADVVAGLESMRSVSGRLLRRDVAGVAVIDDSYNANSGSVRAAIDVLASGVGRKVLVMGHMAELGAEADLRHREIAAYARENRIDALFVVGEFAELMASEFGGESFAFAMKAELIAKLGRFVKSGDTVLVKGSRSAAMEEVVDALSAELVGSNS